MIVRNLLTDRASLKQKIRRLLLYYSRKRGAQKAWKQRHGVVFQKHPEYRNKQPAGAERKHRNLWAPFRRGIPMETLRICGSISGTANPRHVPEEIFQADIEPSLNRYAEANFHGIKHYYEKQHPESGFPLCFLHKIDGEWLDFELLPLQEERLSAIIDQIPFPAVIKPGIASYGGSGVGIVQTPEELKAIADKQNHWVIQERIEQAPELSKYHPTSLNTVRVYLYRSVADNKIHILNRALRVGNGAEIDNVSAGGLVSFIRDSGELNGWALDRYGQKFQEHPLTGATFNGKIPKHEQLNQLALDVAQKLHLLRVVGLDLFFDKNERWRMLETNTKGHTIRFAQYAGQPFFGEFTEEVIEYCKENHWAYSV